MKLTAFVLASLLVLASPAAAWWCTGHMIVAEIARKQLSSEVQQKIQPYIEFMNQLGEFTQSPDMVQAACWADDLKAQGITVMKGWHFIDQPFNPSHMTLPKSSELMNDNVATELTDLQQSAKDRTVQQKTWPMAFTLMNMLHFYGDIHQPLHTAELYNSMFPKGDLGGNLFKVTYNGQPTELHAVWDSVCEKYAGAPLARPLNASSVSFVQAQAEYYINNFNVKDKTLWNATEMAVEGFNYAKQYAYAGVEPNGEVSASYISQCSQIAGLRLAQAGYRLGNELQYVFSRRDSLSAAVERLNLHRRDFFAGRSRL